MSRLKTKFILMFILVLFLSSSLALGVSWLITDLILANVPVVRAALLSRTLNQTLTLIYSLLIASLMIILLTRRMLKPLDRLTKATQEVINGNFDVNVPENSRRDELSRLERNFNKMVRELKGNLYLRKDFTNSISHEFRTPLSTITAYARLIQSGNITDDERKEYSDIILQESSRLTGLTSSILRLSKLDNQTIPENTREFSLDEQIRQVIMLLEPQWNKKNIEMDVDMDECRICTEEELLRQVWQNLIGNAVKFTGEGGVISVTLRYTDKAIIVKVTDNGIGMTEETMSKIFNQFYQGEPLANSEGNGLGLTIVKRILDICDGEITATSKKGQGSSFTVKLHVV
ncbi:MAG: sensor histidine kinase [Christensenellales bacterium]|jgi:signal transduction histidine kinase